MRRDILVAEAGSPAMASPRLPFGRTEVLSFWPPGLQPDLHRGKDASGEAAGLGYVVLVDLTITVAARSPGRFKSVVSSYSPLL
jgi:hypothetical protein